MGQKIKTGGMFNIYYINFSKVYEIAMMINNVIVSSIQRENSSLRENSHSINTSISTALNNLANIKAVVGAQASERQVSSSKMVESLDIKTTKSILLKQIEKKCTLINDFKDRREGDLVKLNEVNLKILNEEYLREFKVLRSDALKGFRVDGVEINNIISSMLQDYSYILYGTMPNIGEEIVIKIPMELENEFESKYNIDDLLIGNVSIIGVYKGDISEEFINKNTFNHLYNIGINQTKEEKKVFSSTYQSDVISNSYNKNRFKEERNFKFIDVIAVIQNVAFKEDEYTQKKIPWYKKIINLIFKNKQRS
ncbi:hypothetical protein [Siminovitchia sp. 179-K 8D1 HS]|uniref:hypothetical protein n=1 Tax=Siminovitchia sp. 179-K 8D1 HS TaxID=3142385 RepID=UPI0039A2459C